MPNCTVNGNAGLHLGSERILKEGNNVIYYLWPFQNLLP